MTNEPPQHPPHGLDLLAGVLAVLLPGLGHVARGETKRGVLAGAGVLALFFGGLLIGGIDVIDSREDKWWFYGEAFVGPIAFGADWVHQNSFKAFGVPADIDEKTGRVVYRTSDRQLRAEHRLRSVFPQETRKVIEVTVITDRGGQPETRQLPVAVLAGPGEEAPNVKSLAKVNEIGTLYALCAGMLNLIVILDALFPTLGRVKRKGAGGA
ncbi:MAG: hypothetical protein K8E66_09870 [Phycisphaerales bacterium]|nr:hypothetical protein [Phycisphaerales bacterium]